MKELIPTHRDNNGNILVSGRDLHKFLEVREKYTQWFERMSEYGFAENVDFTSLSEKSEKPFGGRPTVDHAMTIDMAKEISMLQRNEKGKQARKYFISIENKYKQSQLDTTNLSPELQMFNGLFKALAKNELATKQLDSKVDSISEIVAVSTKDWKNETNHLINKIARQQGNTGDAHRTIRTDIYADVDRRGGVSLNIRLTNLKRRMALEGASKTKLSKVNRVDVISQDKKLIEIYMAIVKEFAIKYGVWKDQY
ncbi:antA/AntB antirepressor family protein [Liquorilactobacillus capillatus]|uniref:Anti-repressor n=1 Tax=Liquorilactobacillus capillatus DSM 19910 TaxID=1423731 RepID=A0A0R1M391_9LACO|nr:antA/AntB antirepressor family protein [Liquorilactobacillus capillatus]KRL02496.1 Anti-repressor [Liquorilactobacillus capillatus DSM 19910]